MTKPFRNNKQRLREWRQKMEEHFRSKGLVRTLDDMSDEDIAALEEQYQMPVRRPKKEESDESDL